MKNIILGAVLQVAFICLYTKPVSARMNMEKKIQAKHKENQKSGSLHKTSKATKPKKSKMVVQETSSWGTIKDRKNKGYHCKKEALKPSAYYQFNNRPVG